jgi:hypothetical protein
LGLGGDPRSTSAEYDVTDEFPVWFVPGGSFSGKTDELVTESLKEVFAALKILETALTVKQRTTIAASMWLDEEYVMVHNQKGFGPFDWGGFVANTLRNRKQGDGKLPHPLLPRYVLRFPNPTRLFANTVQSTRLTLSFIHLRGTAVLNAFEMGHSLRLGVANENGTIGRREMSFLSFVSETDDANAGAKAMQEVEQDIPSVPAR